MKTRKRPSPTPQAEKSTLPFVTGLLTKVAKRIGAKIVPEPEFRYVGVIRFKNGKHTFYRSSNLSINTLGAVEIAKDKAYAAYYLDLFGYHVPRGQTFFNDAWCKRLGIKRHAAAACTYAKKMGFPVIIKPNNFSQGALVVKVFNPQELRSVARRILRQTHIFVVQKCEYGRDYRLVVMDNEVISAYERIPLCIVGDGKRTVRQLLEQKQRVFQQRGRDTILDLEDFRIRWKLRRQKLTFRSIPRSQERVTLLDNANLSTGGESVDVTERLHKDYRNLSVRITKDMGLRLCGVDIMTSDITKSLDPNYVILEINAAPGLDHYAATGKRQEAIVEKLYEKVLRAIERQ